MDQIKLFVIELEARIKQHKEHYQNVLNNKDSIAYENLDNCDLFKGAIYETEMIEVAIAELKKKYKIQ